MAVKILIKIGGIRNWIKERRCLNANIHDPYSVHSTRHREYKG
jgi:hypothetical protein